MKFIIKNHEDLVQVSNYIKNYNRQNEGFTVEVKPIKDIRSLQQNAIWWVLCEACSRKVGETKQWYSAYIKHEYMKEKNISDWIETHLLDKSEMSQIIDYAFHHLMYVVEGYLDEQEGQKWVQYKNNVD